MNTSFRNLAWLFSLGAAAAACSAAPVAPEPVGQVASAATGLTRHLWILNQGGDPSIADFFSCVLGAGSNWNDLANTYPNGLSLDFGRQVIRNDDPCTSGAGSTAFYQCALDAGGFNVSAQDVLLVVIPDSGYGGTNGSATLTNPVTGAAVPMRFGFVRTSPAAKYQTIYGAHEVFEAQTDGVSADCCDGETSSGGPFPWCPSCGPFDNGAGVCGQYAPGGVIGTLGIDTLTCNGTTFSYQRVSPANHEFDGTCDAIFPRSSGNPCKNVPSADNGLYCGSSTQFGFGGGAANTLYTCTNGGVTATQTCAAGCTIAAPGQPDHCATDPCAGVSAANNGQYCGASRQLGFAGGSTSVVYTCTNGKTASTQSCANGCYVAPAGQADGCVGNPCAGVPSADNGLYCGSSTQLGFAHGAPGVLYTCQNGQTTARVSCARGCTVAPAGTADHCN
jgi:hypothetical protein